VNTVCWSFFSATRAMWSPSQKYLRSMRDSNYEGDDNVAEVYIGYCGATSTSHSGWPPSKRCAAPVTGTSPTLLSPKVLPAESCCASGSVRVNTAPPTAASPKVVEHVVGASTHNVEWKRPTERCRG
jgi:hypothetical protein